MGLLRGGGVSMSVTVDISWFSLNPCGLRQRRQGIVNCPFIPPCTPPFPYPHGEDDGVELACQCKCSAALHAVHVLVGSNGITLGKRALWHH